MICVDLDLCACSHAGLSTACLSGFGYQVRAALPVHSFSLHVIGTSMSQERLMFVTKPYSFALKLNERTERSNEVYSIMSEH